MCDDVANTEPKYSEVLGQIVQRNPQLIAPWPSAFCRITSTYFSSFIKGPGISKSPTYGETTHFHVRGGLSRGYSDKVVANCLFEYELMITRLIKRFALSLKPSIIIMPPEDMCNIFLILRSVLGSPKLPLDSPNSSRTLRNSSLSRRTSRHINIGKQIDQSLIHYYRLQVFLVRTFIREHLYICNEFCL